MLTSICLLIININYIISKRGCELGIRLTGLFHLRGTICEIVIFFKSACSDFSDKRKGSLFPPLFIMRVPYLLISNCQVQQNCRGVREPR